MRETRALFSPIVLACISPLASALVAAFITGSRRDMTSPTMLAVNSMFFLLLSIAFLADQDCLCPSRWWDEIRYHLWIGGALYLALVLLFGSRIHERQVPLGIAVFIAAAAEELVFRVLLPAQLFALLRQSKLPNGVLLLLAVTLAQISFASAHFIFPTTSLVTRGWAEAFRLFAGGMIYASLLLASGLGFTVALHAGLNFLLMTGAFSAHPATSKTVGTCILLGIVGVLVCRRDTLCALDQTQSAPPKSPVTLTQEL